MQHLKTVLCLFIFLPSLSFADTASVWLGGGIWDWGISGSIRYDVTGNNSNKTEADLQRDLHLQDDSQSFGYLVIEHPIPVLPNIRIARTTLNTQGSGNTTVAFTYGNTTYSVNESLTTKLNLDQTDFTLYYEVLDNVVGLDIGLNAKNIDGSASITYSGGTENDSVSVTIPMLYAAIDIQTGYGITLGAQGNFVSYDGSSITDYNAYVRYTSDYLLGVELGYRKQSYELDDLDDTYGTIEFSGPYAALFLHF